MKTPLETLVARALPDTGLSRSGLVQALGYVNVNKPGNGVGQV